MQAYHLQDVGKILLQAQQDLKSMRESVQLNENIEQRDIDDVLKKAEENLKVKAKILLDGMMKVDDHTLPAIGSFVNMDERRDTVFKANEISTPIKQKDEINKIIKDFGIPSSKTQAKQNGHTTKRPKGRLYAKKKIFQQHRLLPSVNRNNPAEPIPELSEEDVNGGMLNLINRGFIKPGLDLTPALATGQNMISNRTMRLYHKSDIPAKTMPYAGNSSFSLSTVKLDMNSNVPKEMEKTKVDQMEVEHKKVHTVQFGSKHVEKETQKEQENPDTMQDAVNSIRKYNDLLDTYSLHQFIVRNGLALRETPEFQSFKRTNITIWGSIDAVIDALQHLLEGYSVPIAYVDGHQVVKLAQLDLQKPSLEKLLNCLLNIDQVRVILKRPGQRFRGPNKRDVAATTIQSVFRMCYTKLKLQRNSTDAVAARHIQNAWHRYKNLRKMEKHLKSNRVEEDGQFKKLMSNFVERWDQIKTKRRTIVHIPSISKDSMSRLGTENFSSRQNIQMARLCALADPMVDIVYVTPFDLNEDIKGYYLHLLQLGGVEDPSSRLRILSPENTHRFPDHYSLSSVLSYSPNCMRRIRRYVKGKEAYLVMGVAGPEDRRLAVTLNLPILGFEPDESAFISTIAGGRQVFMDADVNTPLASQDIYSREEMIVALANQIVTNIQVSKWLIKLDDDYNECGVAFLEPHRLKSLSRIKADRQANEYSPEKNPDDIRDEEILLVQEELNRQIGTLVILCFPEVYKHWNTFLRDVENVGAVIEATPSRPMGYFRTNLFIEPTGVSHIISTQDRMANKSNPFDILGSAFPQTLVPYSAAKGASLAIGKSLVDRGLFGYVSIDFMVYADPRNPETIRILGNQICPYMTNAATGFVFFDFLVRGQLESSTGKYLKVDETNVATPRSYVMHEYIFHPNLASMQYTSFFNLCRLNGICFDTQRSVGTGFLLADSLVSGILGTITIGTTHKSCVRQMVACFETISKKVGSQNLQDRLDANVINGNFRAILVTLRSLFANLNRK